MAIYNQVLLYTFRDSLASGDPQKVIFGAYLDGEFGAIHTASLDAVSLSGNNTIAGNNSFTGTNTFSGAGITTTFAGKIVVGPPSTGATISATAASATTTALIITGSSAGQALIQFAANAGANSGFVGTVGAAAQVVADSVLGDTIVRSATGIRLTANGGTSTNVLVGNAGNVTVNSPSSGTTLTINAGADLTALLQGTAAGPNPYLKWVTNAGQQWGLQAVNSSGALRFFDFTRSADVLDISTSGNVTINAPASGNTLTIGAVSGSTALRVNAIAGTYGTQVVAPNTASSSFGSQVIAGTNSSDVAFIVANAAQALNYLQVRGDGQISGGGPVAGALVDMTPDTGTFTGTFTGFTAGITGTCTWTRIGKLVLLAFPQTVQGTSNSTTFTMTGVPAAIQPATLNQTISLPGGSLTDNSTNSLVCGVQITAGSGTFTFERGSGGLVNLWTNSGIKGFSGGVSYTQMTISYLLN